MRFLLTEDHWVLDALNDTEWQFLAELPAIANGKDIDPQSRERLFPTPLPDEALLDEESFEQLEDWNELIRPELENGFREAREQVEKDLGDVLTVTTGELATVPGDATYADAVEDREWKRVIVSMENTDQWYSTLNQARLLLNEAHDLAQSAERFYLSGSLYENLEPREAILLAKYNMFSAIQNILVENVMQ